MQPHSQQSTNLSISSTDSHSLQQRVWCTDWDPSGTFLAVVGSNKTITLFRYSSTSKTLIKIQTILTEHTKTIRYVKFSYSIPNSVSPKKLNIPATNNPIIAAASFDATISIWVTNADGEGESEQYEQLCMLEGHDNEVKCLSWNYNNTKLASCSRDKNIWIWQFDEINYEYTCENVLEGHTQDVKYVQWIIPDKQESGFNRLASCGYDDTIRIWEMEDDDYVCRHILNGHSSIVWSLSFNRSSEYMVSGGEDCSVLIWKRKQDDNSNYEKWKEYSLFHNFPIYCCQVFEFSGQTYVLTGSGDNSIKLSHLSKQGQLSPLSQCHHLSDINHISMHPLSPQPMFVSCSDDEAIKLWAITQ